LKIFSVRLLSRHYFIWTLKHLSYVKVTNLEKIHFKILVCRDLSLYNFWSSCKFLSSDVFLFSPSYII
jgi:hypothetical protein